jgi:hypothetical protein
MHDSSLLAGSRYSSRYAERAFLVASRLRYYPVGTHSSGIKTGNVVLWNLSGAFSRLSGIMQWYPSRFDGSQRWFEVVVVCRWRWNFRWIWRAARRNTYVVYNEDSSHEAEMMQKHDILFCARFAFTGCQLTEFEMT